MANSIKTGLDRFAKAPTEAKPRLIWSGFGEEGAGKTTFGLTGPGPIVVQSLDRGLEGVVEKFTEEKDIRVCEYNWNPSRSLAQDSAIETRDRFIDDFYAAIAAGARTILWDKETQVWEVFRYAEYGAPNDNPKEYGPLYQEYRKLFNAAKESTINFGVIQGMKSPWTKEAKGLTKSTSRIRAGMNTMGELVNINIEHSYDEVAGKFMMKLYKAKGPAAESVQYRMWPFMDIPTLGGMLFPDSPDSAWE